MEQTIQYPIHDEQIRFEDICNEGSWNEIYGFIMNAKLSVSFLVNSAGALINICRRWMNNRNVINLNLVINMIQNHVGGDMKVKLMTIKDNFPELDHELRNRSPPLVFYYQVFDL